MYHVSDDILAALHPDRNALREFLRPYATDERLWRIADEDPLGRETYFADYRAFFDTGQPRPERRFVDTEAAGYAVWGHYWRHADAISREETARHVALAGAIILGGSGEEAALVEVCDEIPDMRAPLLSALAAEYRDTVREEPPRRLLAMLLLSAGIPEYARNETLMLTLTETLAYVLTQMHPSSVIFVEPAREVLAWVAPVRRARPGDIDYDADETHCWAECVYRDLPGLCEGRVREALMAMRVRLCPGADEPPQ